jgi:hypothetical protein
MEASRLDRVHVAVADTLVEITWDEREELIERLRIVTGGDRIVRKFEAVGASRPVPLDE